MLSDGIRKLPVPATNHDDLTNTVRRICTLCGWTRVAAGPGRTLAVTSALDGEGKSSIARAIAISIAQDHASEVLLLECNLLRPCVDEDFGGVDAPGVGVGEILGGYADLEQGIRPTRLPNFWLLPAGAQQPNPSRLLRSAAMPALLSEVRMRFAFVVLDLPAVLSSSDAAVLARLTDGAVLVVRAGATDQRAVQEALQLLSGVTLHGVVLNRWRSAVPDFLRRLVER
jgi:capsular exopolysaccharide synthesis family protein